jgi:hypothetical protein
MNEDIIFLIFAWLCLAGPLIVIGLGFLFNLKWLMGVGMFLVALFSIFSQDGIESGDPQPPTTTRGRLIAAGVLILVGVAVGLFFTGAV